MLHFPTDRPQVLLHRSSEPLLPSGGGTLVSCCLFEIQEPPRIQLSLAGAGGTISLNLERDVVPLNAVCGFLATSDESLREVNRFKALLGERLPWMRELAIGSVDVGEDTTPAILSLLVEERRRLLARNANLLQRAATARRQFEHVQRTLAEMGLFLSQATPDAIVNAVEYAPLEGQRRVLEVTGIGKITCTQRLPVTLRGLAGIDLFIDRSAAAYGDKVEARLLSAEDKHVHAVWTIEPVALQTDVLRLQLPRALDTLDMNPLLQLTGERTALAAFRLGPPHPDPLYCCAFGEGKRVAAPLAMRVRASLPGRQLALQPGSLLPTALNVDDADAGVAPSNAASATPARKLVAALHSIVGKSSLGQPTRTKSRTIAEKALARAHQVTPTPPGINFGVVYYWAEKGGVMVHPLTAGTTVACVPDVLVEPFNGAAVWVESLRHDGPPVEVAVAAGSNDGHMREVLADSATSDQAPVLTSGWSALAPGRSVRLELFASPGRSSGANLYIASRLAPGVQDHEHAWVVLRSVSLK